MKMKSGKGHQEDEEEEDEDFCIKKDATPSNNNAKDVKNSEKANAMRSKHSVTEQRRRSKINERFQILRELIPHSDQKRDTASFLLEVIQYVQFLQEKVQKYEGSCQPWSLEPTKLMPWRNSNWCVQSFGGQPQTTKNGSTFNGRFDGNTAALPTNMQTGQQNPIECVPVRESSCRSMDPQTELTNKAMPISAANDGAFSQSLPGPPSDDARNHQDELTVEGGTISISSVYSQGLLNSLSQALESTGVDLSQASISVRINLGNRANRGPIAAPGAPIAKGHDTNQPIRPFRDPTNGENSDQPQKRLKI